LPRARCSKGNQGSMCSPGVVVLVCVMLGWYMHDWQDGFFPFFYDWRQLYQEELIDAAEWKVNRFRWL
jgi:inner membrane protein